MTETKDPRTRLFVLRQALHEHSRLYAQDRATITDEEYDRMFAELTGLESAQPELFDPNSPTARVGAPPASGFTKVKHQTRMLSLDNAFNTETVIKFFGEGEAVLIEPKIDGLSLEVHYKDGRLIQAATRGDGSTGEDVTAGARTIRSLPLVLAQPVNLRVRGEIYMRFSVLHYLNDMLAESGDDVFANPRNAASGSMKLKDPREVAKRRLSFVAYGVADEFKEALTQAALIDYLGLLGFSTARDLPTYPPAAATTSQFNRKIMLHEASLEHVITGLGRMCRKFDLPTDGLVLKIFDRAKQRELGDGTRSPRWALAYKFPPERKITKLVGISLSVGKTGKITPIAEMAPVTLGGTIVQRASLMNADEIERLNVNVGDNVYVEKSAEIIPRVVGVNYASVAWINGALDCEASGGPLCAEEGEPRKEFANKKRWQMPTNCPSCGKPLAKPKGYVDHYCLNPDCQEQVTARLKHATGKSALDIDGCGKAMIDILAEHGVRDLSDLFTVDPAELGLKPAAKKKFIEGRAKALETPLWRKLHALGIDGFGHTLCQEIAQHWRNLGDVYEEEEKFKELVGKTHFNEFMAFMAYNKTLIERLEKIGFKFEDADRIEGPLSGKVFVITGDLQSGRREEVTHWIEQSGGIVKSSVSKKCHYLVIGDNAGKTKTDAATKHGTALLDETALLQLLGREMPALDSADQEEL